MALAVTLLGATVEATSLPVKRPMGIGREEFRDQLRLEEAT